MGLPDPKYERKLEDFGRRVLEQSGALDPATRQAAASGAALPDPLAAYVDTVRRHAYEVTDADVTGTVRDRLLPGPGVRVDGGGRLRGGPDPIGPRTGCHGRREHRSGGTSGEGSRVRLTIFEHGHRRGARLLLWFTRMVSRKEPPDVVKTLYYRPEFLGLRTPLLNDAMRGPSDWTVGEREVFAAFTSALNQCPF